VRRGDLLPSDGPEVAEVEEALQWVWERVPVADREVLSRRRPVLLVYRDDIPDEGRALAAYRPVGLGRLKFSWRQFEALTFRARVALAAHEIGHWFLCAIGRPQHEEQVVSWVARGWGFECVRALDEAGLV
jgi:hypothetical protein